MVWCFVCDRICRASNCVFYVSRDTNANGVWPQCNAQHVPSSRLAMCSLLGKGADDTSAARSHHARAQTHIDHKNPTFRVEDRRTTRNTHFFRTVCKSVKRTLHSTVRRNNDMRTEFERIVNTILKKTLAKKAF